MKKVLVTGANGQLGMTMQKLYLNNQRDINSGIAFKFVSKCDLDITNLENVNRFFNINKYNYCVNCAAYTNVKQAEETPEPCFKVNALGAENLALACQANNVILIHISTDYVFDGKKRTPYTEEDTTNPINIYGTSKLEGEKAIHKILKKHYIIRTSWLYSEYKNNFVKTMLKLSKERKELNVINNQIGSPTYALDLANLISHILKSENLNYGIYNYSNKGEINWYEFAKSIFSILNLKTNLNPIRSNHFITKVKRPSYSVLDKSKIKNALNLDIPCWEYSLELCLNKLK